MRLWPEQGIWRSWPASLSAPKICGAPFAAQALQGLFQSRRFERFQQIVESVLFERLQGMLFMGGHKDNMGHSFLGQHAQQLQAADPRHLDIEEDHIRLQPVDRGDGFDGIGAFAQHIDIRRLLQQAPQFLAGQRFVIDNQDIQHAGAVSRGRRRMTRVKHSRSNSTSMP